MVVNYFGGACFRLQSGDTTLLVDPANNRLKADVLLRTITSPNTVTAFAEIVFPGEYEVQNIEIRGLGAATESTEKYLKTVYVVTWEDMRFVFLGHLSRVPGEDVLEEIAEPDVLFLPAGEHLIPAGDAAKLVRKLEPAVTIPSFYKNPGEFLRAFGVRGEAEEKFVFRRKDLTGHKGKVVVLQAKGA